MMKQYIKQNITSMKIPNNIHFAGFDYKVKQVTKLDGGENWGRTELGEMLIFLEKGVNIQKKEETFIHELLHIALRHTTGWQKLSSDDEENLVKSWSMNIYGILKDNKLLK